MQAVSRVFAIAVLISVFTTASAQVSPTSNKLEAPLLYEKTAPSVVVITCVDGSGQASQGSGAVLRADGVIATNFHVIAGAISARVQFANGDVYDDVSVLDTDDRRDIAILKIKAINLPILPSADSDSVKIGATVYVIGAPGGLSGSMSSGIVSGIRPANEVSPTLTGFRLIQFTAPISPGSSGGPLFDESGRVLGLVFASRIGGQNLNVAIPENYVAALLANAKSDGRNLKKMTDSMLSSMTRSPERSNGEIADLAGTYTGPWTSDNYNVSGTLSLTISVVNGQAEGFAVFTGSEYLNQEALIVTLTPLGSGVWKMNYKGKKSKLTGTGIFREGNFVGDYTFKKLLWVDHGRWNLHR